MPRPNLITTTALLSVAPVAALMFAAFATAAPEENKTTASAPRTAAASAAMSVPGTLAWTDTAGRPHSVRDFADAPATVFLFSSPECPIAGRYAPRLAELARDYANKNVRFFLVYSGGEPSATPEAAWQKYAEERRLSGSGLVPVRDRDASLAAALHATTTPQAVLVDATGTIRYLGRVDDNVEREKVNRQDLRRAVDAVLAGQTVAVPRTQAFGCAIARPEATATTVASSVASKAPTYARDVAPILNKNCVACHREGSVGPFTLDSYAQAKLWASAIKYYTSTRKMPPWKAEPDFGGPFHDARYLTDSEIATIGKWAAAGAPAGDLKKAPAPPRLPVGDWSLGKPDVVLSPSRPFRLGAEGGDVYRDFALDYTFDKDTYIKAMDFAAGTPTAVHHIIAYIDVTGNTVAAREGKEADGQPGWEVTGAGSGIKDWEWGAGWAPGMQARFMEPGLALKVPKGARLVLQVHYHKSGKEEADLSRVALYFAKPDEPITQNLKVAALGNPILRLQPNEARNVVTAKMRLPYDATLHTVLPHMHLLGKEMTVTARLPDGQTVIPLIRVRDWEFHWQMAYSLQKPLRLPQGTMLELTAVFDNSADNPYQPNNPPREVRFGESTTDEMCFAFLGFARDVPATPAAPTTVANAAGAAPPTTAHE